MMQTQPTVPLVPRSPGAWALGEVDLPQPPPDVVPLPPSPHPVPQPTTVPPEISDPVVPGQNVPVQEPVQPIQ